jgi:outer membrane protein insertion porin family
VRIVGDRPEPVRNLLARHGLTNDQLQDRFADSVALWLVDEGYLDVEVSRTKDTVVVEPGEQAMLVRIIVVADSTTERSVSMPFTKAALEQVIDGLLSEYFDGGYYYARAEVSSLSREGNRIAVNIKILKGPVVTIHSLQLVGLTRTKSSVVSRDLPAMPGDTLTDLLLERIGRAATGLTYVQYLPPVQVRPLSGYTQADIEIAFSERQQMVFAGGAGYQNDQDQGLIWDLSLQLPNLFGEGKQLALRSERRQKGRNLLDISYRQPSNWLGRSVLSGELSTRDYRDDFYEFSLRAGFDLYLSQGTKAGIGLGWKRVEPSDSTGYSRYDVGVGFDRIELTDEINPSAGYSLETSVAYSYRRRDSDSLSAGRGFNETRATLNAAIYSRIAGALVTKVGLGYRGIESQDNDIPISELFLIGGPGSLRGYRNEQFAAVRVVLGTVEPRIRFDGGYLFGFWDGALLQSESVTPYGGKTDEIFRQGYGGGVTLATSNRSIQISLGWNRDLSFDQPYLSIAFLSGL